MRRCSRWPRRHISCQPADANANAPQLNQHFQICLNIIEARRLIWNYPQLATSYVVVGYGKKRRRTCVRKHMIEPCYRESFIFETFKSLRDLEKSSIWLAVMEPRCCAPPRLLGETNIDLGSIWAQPNHQVNQKWIQLSLPTGSVGSVGFLKIDISIIYRGEFQMQVMHCKKIGDNFLTNLQSSNTGFEHQKANYQIAIFAAFGLAIGDRRYHGRPPNTLVRVSFCGLMGKTSVHYRDHSPVYSELISIVEMFPNTRQTICIDVCGVDGLITRVLGTTHLDLGLVSHDGDNGFLPTFGPSLLHLYGTPGSNLPETDSPYNQGALLVSLKTAVPFDKQKLRSVNVEPITPVNMDTLWNWEEFCIYCPILEVSMVESWLEGKCCGVSITIGEMFNQYGGGKADGGEFCAMLTEIRGRKLNHVEYPLKMSAGSYMYLDLSKGFPVLQLAAKLPDFRFRMFRNNMVERIVANLSHVIENVEHRFKESKCECLKSLIEDLNKAADDTAADITRFLDAIKTDEIMGHPTELDVKQLALMEEKIEKIYKDLPTKRHPGNSSKAVVTRKKVKELLTALKSVVDQLKSLINKTPHGWPHIVVWLTSGGARIAYHKVSPHEILYSSVSEQKGINAGTLQTIYLKPLKCFRHQNSSSSSCSCVTAKIELQVWMGLYKQYYAFEDSLPHGYRIKLRGYNIFLKANPMMYECRVFIYSAKLNYVSENSFTNIFVRVHIMNKVSHTKFQPKSMSPIWNQVLKLHIETFTTQEKVVTSPPEATVDVCESQLTGKENVIARLRVRPVVDDRQCYEYAPKLRCFELCNGSEQVGNILMSVQLVQIPEKLVKTTLYNSPLEECYYGSSSKEFNNSANFNIVETLPSNLLPQIAAYKIDIYWWGLRDLNIPKKPCVMLEINNLTVKSDVLYDKQANCNFSHRHTSHIFEAPLSEPYCPPLNIRLYDSNTFGRTLFLGTNVVKNPKKFLVNWIPKSERESLVKGKSVQSLMFRQVNQVLHVSTNRKPDNKDCELKNSPIDKEKSSKWRKFIRRKRQPKEEEYTLLPMFDKDVDEMKVNKRCCERTSQRENWWLRYFSSQKHLNDADTSLDKIVIYPSELETQPEFSKFRDWCFNLKFYNGTRTGNDVRDNQIYYGSLKAGIAIYNWPPPEDTVAVSTTGVDLKEGYFSDYPINDAAKFLVRVYVLKILNIVFKNKHDKNDPCVVISVGKKRYEDQQRHSQSTDCSIIGEMYELRCTLPDDYLLTLSLYDREGRSSEDLIGKTEIDLEDRIYTKHKASVGLSPKYNLMGGSKWRDSRRPSAILEEICARNHLPKPSYPDITTVIVNGVEYRNDVMKCVDCTNVSSLEGKENICLNILHQWHTLPICGYHLVPEHVETRTLYRPDKPGVSQGQILMWIDIFPFNIESIPPPIDITPPKAEEYELRIVIWDLIGLKINKRAKHGLDIFARGSIGCDQAQSTDVCYGVRSEANFNWRMIFQFCYQHAEKKLIFKEKGPYTEYEERLSPNFKVQVIDNKSEDIIASLTLNLTSFPRGAKVPQLCLMNSEKHKKVNLFVTRSIKAWWPMQTMECEGSSLAGTIHLEMTLLPKEQADLIPVGLGRGPPSPLPDPQGRESRSQYLDYLCGQDSYTRRNIFKLLLWMFTLITLLYLIVHVDFSISHIQELLDDTGLFDGGNTRALHPVD